VRTLQAIFFLSFLTLILNTSMYASDKKEILWLQHQRSPWMISSGPFKNQGYGDKIRQIIETSLSQYSHKTLPINPPRLLKELKLNDNICYGPVGKLPVFKDKFHWSKALYVLTGFRIITLDATNKKLNYPKEISMKKLLLDKNLIFGQITNMWHYPIKIEEFEHLNNIRSISSSAPLSSLLNMMKKGRIDWVFDHPVYVKWANTITNLDNKENFVTIKVKESKDAPLLVGYFGCSKNSFGKQAIQDINKHITEKNVLQFRSLVQEWQLNSETLKSFKRLNKDFFGF